jgi:hypothetical protein
VTATGSLEGPSVEEAIVVLGIVSGEGKVEAEDLIADKLFGELL